MKKILYFKDNKVQEINEKDFYEKLKVDNIIRIQEKDFNQIDLNNKKITHFNLRNTKHLVGDKYAIVKIKKPGGIDKNGKEFMPIFDLSKIIIGKCIKFEFKDINEVTKKDFEFSMKNIQNLKELKKEILFRYKKFRVGKTEEEIFSEGISLTILDIEEIINNY